MEPNLISTRRRLRDVAAFTTNITHIQAASTLSIHEKAQAIFHELEAALTSLAATGQLTEQVEQELLRVASVALTGYTQVQRDVGEALQRLLAAYDPPRPTP